MSAEQEDIYWSSLEGDAILNNTAGFPPYDAEAVGRRIVSASPANPARVLDLGCGVGRLTNHLAYTHSEWSFHGVDISRPLLDQAVVDATQAHIANVHYWHGNGRTLPSGLGARQYDLVYSVTVLQHLPHDAKLGYIREVEKRLKPGGVFVFTIAEGDESMFLNHQVDDVVGWVRDEVAPMGDWTWEVDYPPGDVRMPNWVWVTLRKAS